MLPDKAMLYKKLMEDLMAMPDEAVGAEPFGGKESPEEEMAEGAHKPEMGDDKGAKVEIVIAPKGDEPGDLDKDDEDDKLKQMFGKA